MSDEFLREETRKQRRNLDIVAVLAGLVVFLNLVPNRISAVGVDFGETRKQTFLILLLVFDVWFLLVFAIYAASDLAALFPSLKQEGREAQLLQDGEEPRHQLKRLAFDSRVGSQLSCSPTRAGCRLGTRSYRRARRNK